MKAPRTIPHDGAWCTVALHLLPAGTDQGGFYLTLNYDTRQPAVVYLRPEQMESILDLAVAPSSTDGEVWERVQKTPLEPLPPSRYLAQKLRPLLQDSERELRQEIQSQLARRPPPPPIEEGPESIDPSDAPPPPKAF